MPNRKDGRRRSLFKKRPTILRRNGISLQIISTRLAYQIRHHRWLETLIATARRSIENRQYIQPWLFSIWTEFLRHQVVHPDIKFDGKTPRMKLIEIDVRMEMHRFRIINLESIRQPPSKHELCTGRVDYVLIVTRKNRMSRINKSLFSAAIGFPNISPLHLHSRIHRCGCRVVRQRFCEQEHQRCIPIDCDFVGRKTLFDIIPLPSGRPLLSRILSIRSSDQHAWPWLLNIVRFTRSMMRVHRPATTDLCYETCIERISTKQIMEAILGGIAVLGLW